MYSDIYRPQLNLLAIGLQKCTNSKHRYNCSYTSSITKKIFRQGRNSLLRFIRRTTQCLPLINVLLGIGAAGVPFAASSQQTSVYVNYIAADSVHFPLHYYTSYMFNTNARYTLADTGVPSSNQLLIQSFGVFFDSIIDANHNDTGYAAQVVGAITIDSISILIGHQIDLSMPAHQDTIVVQFDSINAANGYISPYVYYIDTVYTGNTGLSPGNSWLSPYNLIVRPRFPNGLLINNNKFAITVSFYGPKTDTLGFLPGFPYAICQQGGSGVIPLQTKIGQLFGNATVNSITSGYQYFFGRDDTIPTAGGSTNGLYLHCSNPAYQYWYFQDNPIGAYITFQNLTGLNEVSTPGFYVLQNTPNPFNTQTQINYRLAVSSDVRFTITDITGRTLSSVTYLGQSTGEHSIILDGNRFCPGIYFYTFNIGGNLVTRKMIVTK